MIYENTFPAFLKEQIDNSTYEPALIRPFPDQASLSIAQGYLLYCITEEILELRFSYSRQQAALELADIALFLEALAYAATGTHEFVLALSTTTGNSKFSSYEHALVDLYQLCPNRKTWKKMPQPQPSMENFASWFIRLIRTANGITLDEVTQAIAEKKARD